MKKCEKHVKYKGKGTPPENCPTCLELYWLLQKPRIPFKPTEIIKDKKKYTRKRKHKTGII